MVKIQIVKNGLDKFQACIADKDNRFRIGVEQFRDTLEEAQEDIKKYKQKQKLLKQINERVVVYEEFYG